MLAVYYTEQAPRCDKKMTHDHLDVEGVSELRRMDRVTIYDERMRSSKAELILDIVREDDSQEYPHMKERDEGERHEMA